MTAHNRIRIVKACGVLLLLLWLVDFWFDVRHRDAFTWMDPFQYFNFAYDVLHGLRAPNAFETASFFPFFILPFLACTGTIAGAFLVQAASMLLIAGTTFSMSRSLKLHTPAILTVALVLSSPLLIGLSRSLYSEFTLAAWTGLVFALWFKTDAFHHRVYTGLLMLSIAVGFLLKMTFPLFLVGACGVEALQALRMRSWRHLFVAAGVVALPILVAVGLVGIFFPTAFAYYKSLGNTAIPIMHLIGPTGILSWESATYYFSQGWRVLFFLLTPLLILPVWAAIKSKSFNYQTAILWGWLLAPLLLLVLQDVKEPRHVAPCVIPGVLLIVSGIENLASRRARFATCGLAGILALLQYGAATLHLRTTPYFLDRPSHFVEVFRACVEADTETANAVDAQGNFSSLRWNYGRTIGLRGFDPNMALLYAWLFNPGIVVDLDQLDAAAGTPPLDPGFEDLFFINAFNLYNRRCGWTRPLRTVNYPTALAALDFLLVQSQAASNEPEIPDGFEAVTTFGAPEQALRIYRNTHAPRRSLRVPYARQYLADLPADTQADRAAIGFELLMVSTLRWDPDTMQALAESMPLAQAQGEGRRNIYWMKNYNILFEVGRHELHQRTTAAP